MGEVRFGKLRESGLTSQWTMSTPGVYTEGSTLQGVMILTLNKLDKIIFILCSVSAQYLHFMRKHVMSYFRSWIYIFGLKITLVNLRYNGEVTNI